MVRFAVLLGLTGCQLVFAAEQNCYGTGFLEVCTEKPLTSEKRFTAEMVDTDTECEPLQDSSIDVCVLGGQTVILEISVRAIGENPLVLVGNEITIDGTLDLSAATSGAERPPAGSNRGDCDEASAPAQGLGGGGFGGTYGTPGGNGGGLSNGGTPPTVDPEPQLRGGCRGGSGDGGGEGGFGGGGLALLARDRIIIRGTVNVSGAGGLPGSSFGRGGGGGGAGGTIILDAPDIDIEGRVFSNGGGGGGGMPMGGGIATAGARPTSPDVPAQGGIGSGAGGAGGALALAPEIGGTGIVPGHGGGGGAVGILYVFPRRGTDPTKVSPSPTD